MANPYITVDGLIYFNSTDLVVTKEGREAAVDRPEALLEAIRTALPHMQNRYLVDANSGARGPLASHSFLTFEEFLVALDEIDAAEQMRVATRAAKVGALKQRRAEFGASRAALILKMLSAGVVYRCAHPGCAVIENLTVDHITPMSRGGTDDIENLQFMCHPHNSAKGDRI